MIKAQSTLQPIRLCVRDTTTSGKHVFSTRSLHTYLWCLTYSSTVKDLFKSISVEIWTDISLGKAQRAWSFSPCWWCKTLISCQNSMKKLQGFVWLPRAWWPAHTISTHLKPFLFMSGGTRLDIARMLMGYHGSFAWGHHLLL